MAFWKAFFFQNIMSKLNSDLDTLHDFVMVWLVLIVIVVLVSKWLIFTKKLVSNLNLNFASLEIVWTFFPVLILVSIAIPSILLLCFQDSAFWCPTFSCKLVSNQWNWQSDLSDHFLDSDKLEELGNFESPVLLPLKSMVRIMMTSSDVLHSLGVPGVGIKLDSTPGRLNAATLETSSFGLMPGACYELCGSGHSAMPIFMLVI